MKYRIMTAHGEFYDIDEDGCFLLYGKHTWVHPHTSWKCTGCAEILPFNNLRFHDLKTLLKMIRDKISFSFKNGKPKFTLTDLDHGTHRVHGNWNYHGIRSAWALHE